MAIYYGADLFRDYREQNSDKPLSDIFVNPIAYNAARFETINKGTYFLSDDGSPKNAWGGYVRATSWIHFRDRVTGREFIYQNSHPDNKSAEARLQATKLDLAFLKNHFPNLPSIFTADSNTSVDSVRMGLKRWADPDNKSWDERDMCAPYDVRIQAGFKDAWKEAYRTPVNPDPIRPCTYHSFQGTENYLAKGGDGWGTSDTELVLVRGFRVLNCTLVENSSGGIWPSDHKWMAALVQFEE
jgi:hypothetical protein